AMKAPASPTSPMIVLVFPRETKASPEASRTLSTTRSMSSSVALLFITTTITTSYSAGERVPGPRKQKTPGPSPGVLAGLALGGRRLRRATPVGKPPVAIERPHVGRDCEGFGPIVQAPEGLGSPSPVRRPG